MRLLRGVSGSVETVEDRAGNVGDLVDLLRGEPVENQAPDLLGVAGDGGAERGAPGGGDGSGASANRPGSALNAIELPLIGLSALY